MSLEHIKLHKQPSGVLPAASRGIKAVWLRPVSPEFRPLVAGGTVEAFYEAQDEVSAEQHWQALEVVPAGSYLSEGQGEQLKPAEPWVRVRLRLTRAAFQLLLGLALPQKHAFLMVVQLNDGAHYLLPWQRGLTLLTWLWLQEAEKPQGYRADFIGYGKEGILPLAKTLNWGHKAYNLEQQVAVDWSADALPLQMIRDTDLANL